MTIKPVKFTVREAVLVDGHHVGDGIYVGQKLTETEIERSRGRNASYFLHFAPAGQERDISRVKRLDLDVTHLVKMGRIEVN